MAPKEKAIEIIEKYLNMDDGLIKEFIPLPIKAAKNCALIAVNEIMHVIDWHEFETPNEELNYWNRVILEINRL
jgi:hypothetical protein